MALNEALQTSVLGISEALCDDLVVCLSNPRYQILSWFLPWNDLHRLCIMYLQDPQSTKNFVTELKFVDIDYSIFKGIKREPLDDLAGIEKGYEQYLDHDFVSDEETSSVSEDSMSQDSRPYSLGSDGAGDGPYLPLPQPKSDPNTLKSLRMFRPTLKRTRTDENISKVPEKIPKAGPSVGLNAKDLSKGAVAKPSLSTYLNGITSSVPAISTNTKESHSKNVKAATLPPLGGQVAIKELRPVQSQQQQQFPSYVSPYVGSQDFCKNAFENQQTTQNPNSSQSYLRNQTNYSPQFRDIANSKHTITQPNTATSQINQPELLSRHKQSTTYPYGPAGQSLQKGTYQRNSFPQNRHATNLGETTSDATCMGFKQSTNAIQSVFDVPKFRENSSGNRSDKDQDTFQYGRCTISKLGKNGCRKDFKQNTRDTVRSGTSSTKSECESTQTRVARESIEGRFKPIGHNNGISQVEKTSAAFSSKNIWKNQLCCQDKISSEPVSRKNPKTLGRLVVCMEKVKPPTWQTTQAPTNGKITPISPGKNTSFDTTNVGNSGVTSTSGNTKTGKEPNQDKRSRKQNVSQNRNSGDSSGEPRKQATSQYGQELCTSQLDIGQQLLLQYQELLRALNQCQSSSGTQGEHRKPDG
ncbi:hypothetical protein NQ317_006994 [Molorchus minor]|uniref:Uncharacterized protein n=1 Tax=Molorchus minor TaxID=1323400 RepID=A0ABQ9JT63_9CUCU|nr:hypothetical protein NQ317_006994 [Molorchus minor]